MLRETMAPRFCALWQKTSHDSSAEAEPVWAQLSDRYAEPHRAYHNLDHIAHCLRAFDDAAHLALSPDAIEMAIWFHDVIYNAPDTTGNEAKSVELYSELAGSADSGFVEQVLVR